MSDRYPETLHISKQMADMIDMPVDAALISSRPGGGNTTQSFVKGDIVTDALNQVFGPLGWGVKAKIHQIDDWEEEKTKTQNNRQVTVQMKVVQVVSDVELTIKKVTPDGADTVFVQPGIGYGEVEAGKSTKEAFGMAIKGAATDGLKRCANLLGRKFGMMMASNGSQEDIEYAHNGKRDNLEKARKLRNSQGSGSGNSSGRSNQSSDRYERNNRDPQENRSQQDDRGNQRGGNPVSEARSDSRGSREENRGRSENGDHQNAQRQSSRDGEGQATERNQAVSREERPSDRNESRMSSEKSGAEVKQDKKSSERKPDTNYDLNIVPITKQDMVDFGATLVERVKEMRQVNDRIGLVRQHINTIKNLDTSIRQRVIERLSEANVDVDKIQS